MENFFEEELYNLGSSIPGQDSEEMGVLGQLINYHVDAILALYCGEPNDEVHGDSLLLPFRNGERLQ